MQIGWIDFSKDERNKVLNVIHLLEEPGTIDELGLGTIRDAFSDFFFPGTSTIQTRAKYFLIVSYILKEAGSGKYGINIKQIEKQIIEKEKKCREIFIKNFIENNVNYIDQGIIGSLNSHGWVMRPPSNIYWNGIKKLKIFNSQLSINEYLIKSIDFIKSENITFGNRKNDENEIDDADCGDIEKLNFWSLDNTYKNNWLESLKIELTKEEAIFLKNKIIDNYSSSLFSYILKNNNICNCETFKDYTNSIKFENNDELKEKIILANDFNNLVHFLMIRFNIIVSRNKNLEVKNIWEEIEKSNDFEKFIVVDLEKLFDIIEMKDIKVELKSFLRKAKEFIKIKDMKALDELIIKREYKLKGVLAKTKNPKKYESDKWIGFKEFDYRFKQAKRIATDIICALEK